MPTAVTNTIVFAGSIQPAGTKDGTVFRQPAMFGRPTEDGDGAVDGSEGKKSMAEEYVRKPRAPKIKIHSDVPISKKDQKKVNKLRPKITWHEGRGEKDNAMKIMLQIQEIYVNAEKKDSAWQKS